MKKEKYAFIVGEGNLPHKVISAAKNKNLDFVIAGIKGISDKKLVNNNAHFWFYLGEVGSLLNHLRQYGVTTVILLGAIKRPSLWAIRTDSLGRDIIKKYLLSAGGDDSLLSKIIAIFEEKGFKVGSPQDIDESILAVEKTYTTFVPKNEMLTMCYEGFKVAKEISKLDIGQSIIMQQNMVVAVEAVEGTKAMILRAKSLLKKHGEKGVLIKVSKLNQEQRVDLPTIGEKTIMQAKKVGLAGIVIEAGNTIILNQEKAISLANKYGIFIIAIKGKSI